MSVRLRETIKKIRRNLSLRTLSKDDRKSNDDGDDDCTQASRGANRGGDGGGFWSRHHIGRSSGAGKFSISADAGLDKLPASWPAVENGSLGGSPIHMPAPASSGWSAKDDGAGDQDDDEEQRCRLSTDAQLELEARLAGLIGSMTDNDDESCGEGSGAGVPTAVRDEPLSQRRPGLWSQQQQEVCRSVKLIRAAGSAGYGFIAGGQRPMVVRTVDQGEPGEGLLFPGDQIVEVNGVNTETLPQLAVLELIRQDSNEVQLTVRQPPQLSCTKSILRGNSDEGKKLRKSSSRVRFSEAIQELDVEQHKPTVMKDVTMTNAEPQTPTLKIYLENNQTRTVQFDESTTVEDLLRLLLQKLEISAAADHFAIVVGEPGSPDTRHFRALARDEMLVEALTRGGQCGLRLLYAPKDPYDLLKNDGVAFDYLYKQCCNALMDDTLVPDASASQSSAAVALRLASLFMLEHALIQGIPPSKVTAKKIDKEFGLRTFVMPSVAATMAPKWLHRKLDSFFKLNRGLAAPGQKRVTALQARLHFMQIAAGLPLFCARRFAVRLLEREELTEVTLFVGPNCGISRAMGYTLQRKMQLEDISDIKLIDPPEDQFNGTPLKLVELRHVNQSDVTRWCMSEALAYDFCAFVKSYRAAVTGSMATGPFYLSKSSRDHLEKLHQYNRFPSYSDSGDVFLPPADYDESRDNSDGEEGGDDNDAVNSALSAAFDDLDDCLLAAAAADAHEDAAVGAGAVQLSTADIASDDSDRSNGDILRGLAGEVKFGHHVLAPAGSSPLSSASRPPTELAVLANGELTQHDEEIGIQMSAIDAATASDGCPRGDDESGIDSDSEDSGNETLNSADTNPSFALAEVQRSERIYPRDQRGAADRASECAPAISFATSILQNFRQIAERRPALDGSSGGGSANAAAISASLTRITFNAMAHGASIIGPDADDVSTEEDDDDDDDVDDGRHKEATGVVSNGERRGSAGLSNCITAAVLPDQDRIPIVVATSRSESECTTANATLAMRRRATLSVAPTVAEQQRTPPSNLPLAESPSTKQRLSAARPVSDGFILGTQWRSQPSPVSEDVARPSHRLVRQDATDRAPVTSPVAASTSVVVNSPTRTAGAAVADEDPSPFIKARGARSATVASTSKLAQAFMKLSASKASGSYDFCPATPPRLRPISAPFNMRSTAHGVLANAKPVRTSLSDDRETLAVPDVDSQTSVVSALRIPRPPCPPPPPPLQPSASVGARRAAEDSASLSSPTLANSSRSRTADAASGAQRVTAETAAHVAQSLRDRAAVIEATSTTGESQGSTAPAAAAAAAADSSSLLQLRSRHDIMARTATVGQGASPLERRRAVGAQFTVRSSSGVSLRAVADADSVSYKLDNQPSEGADFSGASSTISPLTDSHSATGAASQTKNRVLDRILGALKLRKKPATLSRAVSAIELTTENGSSKSSSLPRWIGNAPKQRPSILSQPREVTLLRAMSYGDCGGERDMPASSFDDAQSTGLSSLPAAEICTINTTATSQRDTWSRSSILETFLAQSPTIATKLPASGGFVFRARVNNLTPDEKAASPADAGQLTACDRAGGLTLARGDANMNPSAIVLPAATVARDLVVNLNEATAANSVQLSSREVHASEAITSRLRTCCAYNSDSSGANDGERRSDDVFNDKFSTDSTSPLYDIGTTVSVQQGDALSKTSSSANHMQHEAALADGGSKPFTVECPPNGIYIQHADVATNVVTSAVVSEERNSHSDSEFSTAHGEKLGQVEKDENTAAPPRTVSPEALNTVAPQASIATPISCALTETLAAIDNQPPKDAAQACTFVESLLVALRSSIHAASVAFSSATLQATIDEQLNSHSENGMAAAATVVKQLLVEAQRMVGECKQMVAAIARRQRSLASASSSSSPSALTFGSDADRLRDEELCCILRSFATFTRLMNVAVQYHLAAAAAATAAAAADRQVQDTSTYALRNRLLSLGKAFAVALRAAVSSPSPASAGDSTTPEMDAVEIGACRTSGVAEQRSESPTDSDPRPTTVARSTGSPSVGSSDVAVRRLMTIATELATALGALIRLLRQDPFLSPNTATSDEI